MSAAFISLFNGNSQGVFIGIGKSYLVPNLLAVKKVRKIVLLDCVASGIYVASLIKEVLGYTELKINCITDNEGFIEVLYSSKNVENKYCIKTMTTNQISNHFII